MKKIINGKKYDTETAVYICGYEYGTCNDFSHIKESLYRKGPLSALGRLFR